MILENIGFRLLSAFKRLGLLSSCVYFLTALQAFSGTESLQSGPMLGYSEMREVAIWLQTKEAAKVRIAYWEKGAPSTKRFTETKTTDIESAYTTKIIPHNLTPGTRYAYEVQVNGTSLELPYTTEFQTIPFYRERVPPPDFTVAFAGGNYVNDEPYDPLNRKPGDEYSAYLAVLSKKPDAMIWTGNNIFLRETDWNSFKGMTSRYTFNRARPELQPLLASVHHTAVWSTHDYGREGADTLTWNKKDALNAFKHFWANPSYGVADMKGTMTTMRWSDVDFFLLDDRTYRSIHHRFEDKRKVLGDAQIDWLIEMLKRSPATFKIIVVGTPILNPATNNDNLITAKSERRKLLGKIKDNKIGGILIVSGGKAHGELTKMVRSGAPDFYELTVGTLTARPAKDTKELNYFRVPGTSSFKRHFSTLSFQGPEQNRTITIKTFDTVGEELWTESFTAQELSFKKK